MADKWMVERLRPVKGKTDYGHEMIKGLSQAAADELTTVWWASGGTHALAVIRPDGKPSAVYEKEYRDATRIPPVWKWTTKRRKPSEDNPLGPDPPPPPPIPTLGDEEPEPDNKKIAAGACLCCAMLFDPERSDKDDRDKSPSGRIAKGCCPECGMWLPGMGSGELQQMYLRHTSKDPTPGKWRPKWDF